jgi:hypothetical protein
MNGHAFGETSLRPVHRWLSGLYKCLIGSKTQESNWTPRINTAMRMRCLEHRECALTNSSETGRGLRRKPLN